MKKSHAAILVLVLLSGRWAVAQTVISDVPNGKVIRFRDDAYDGAWREFLVPSGGVTAEVRTRVVVAGDRIRYEFLLTPIEGPIVRYWMAETAPEVELHGPTEWACHRNDSLRSVIECEDASPQSTGPTTPTPLRWETEGQFLPAVTKILLRSHAAAMRGFVDLPPDVKRTIASLERSTAIVQKVIAPWIPTVEIRDGRYEPVAAPKLLEGIITYLREAIEETSDPGMIEALARARDASKMLEAGNKQSGSILLTNAIASASTSKPRDAWSVSLRDAFVASLNYVIQRIS